MERTPKGIDNKLTTNSRLHLNYRQKKLAFATFALGNEVDLPPINSVLVKFPSVNKEKVDIKNSRKRRNIIELDRILESNNQKISSDDINRIIFASPMKNRITFQRTFFRSSLYFTIDDKKSKNDSSSLKGSSPERRQEHDLSYSSTNNKQQNQKVQQIKINWLSEPSTLDKSNKSRYSNVLDSNPETILERRKKERTLRQVLEARLPHNLNRSNQRYSPWKNDDLEEQLIL